MTTATPEIGASVLVETKPFIDSDRIDLDFVEILKIDRLIWHVTRNGRGHFCIPVHTIRDWTEA